MTLKSIVSATLLLLATATMAQNSAPSKKPASAAQFSTSDRLFLKALIQEDMSEISLAQMALEKTSNADVKQYAQMNILAADPHMKDGAAQLARKHGINPPTGPNGRQQEMYSRLEKKSGKIFDSAYMSYEADQQHADVKLVQTEIDRTNDPEIKSFVTAEQKPVAEAAAAAQKIATKIASSMTHYKQQPNRTGSQH